MGSFVVRLGNSGCQGRRLGVWAAMEVEGLRSVSVCLTNMH